MVSKFQRKRNSFRLYLRVPLQGAKTFIKACFLIFIGFVTSSCVAPNKKTDRFQEVKLKDLKIKNIKLKKDSLPEQKPSEDLKEGLLLYKAKDYKKAFSFFKKKSETSSSSQSQALFYSSLCLFELNQKEEALKVLKKIPNKDSWFNQGLLLHWKILVSQKNSSNKEKLFVLSQLIQEGKSFKIKNKGRNIAYKLAQKTPLNTLKTLEKDSAFEGIREIISFHIGRTLVQENKYSQALSYFKKVAQYSSDNIYIEEKISGL